MIARSLGAGALVAACLVFLAPAPSAQACSCVGWSVKQSARSSDAVFTGTIAGREVAEGSRAVVYRVSVVEVWKGNVAETVTVTTADQESACGLPDLPTGKSILWFAGITEEAVIHDEKDEDFSTNVCSGTKFASQADTRAVTAALGEAQRPLIEDRLPPGAEDRHDDRNMALAVTAGVVAVGAAAYLVLRRRRGTTA